MGKTKEFITECKRVLKVTKKPSIEEFKGIVKVTGLGILVIGFVGFVVTMLYTIIFK